MKVVRYGRHSWQLVASIIGMVLVGVLLVSCASNSTTTTGQTLNNIPPVPPATTLVAANAPTSLQVLKVTPEKGFGGTSISVTGEGLPLGKPVDFFWTTVQGSYVMKQSVETIEFSDRNFVDKRMPLGKAVTDAQGRVTVNLVVPEDFGETHDIIAVVDNQDVAKGGFYVTRDVTINPLSGPVGTLITIEVNGLGWTSFRNTLAVLYDNKYTGFISAVTTGGTVKAQFRAAGTVGPHEVRVANASAAVPYLNLNQSPVKDPEFKFVFDVTKDDVLPPQTLEWPDSRFVNSDNSAIRTTVSNINKATPGVDFKLSPSSGPILSRATLQASGLPADMMLDIYWVSAKGNRVSPSGWNLVQTNIGKATTSSSGLLRTDIQIPEDLGGWHNIKIAQGEKVLAETQYFVEHSIVGVTPSKVKSGETFKIQIKGIGWTELDNGAAVTYDNGYIGYVCGFNSQGDVTIFLGATGGPGIHLIDLYPMIFKGHGLGLWDYNIPQLSFGQDNPGLALGYRLPAIRLAIEVIP